MEREEICRIFRLAPKWSLKPRGAANKIVAYNPLAINKNATQPRNRTHKKHRRAIHAANVPSRAPAMLFTALRILFFCSRRPPFSIRTGERRGAKQKKKAKIASFSRLKASRATLKTKRTFVLFATA
tara:strand:- start:66 stop:446 length:381 start_codon:yes stop_codon:yes gene_type:complete